MWAGLAASILVGILKSLFTQTVVVEVGVKILRYLTPKTTNELDDEILKTVEKALGVAPK
jgi:hypothetical protein